MSAKLPSYSFQDSAKVDSSFASHKTPRNLFIIMIDSFFIKKETKRKQATHEETTDDVGGRQESQLDGKDVKRRKIGDATPFSLVRSRSNLKWKKISGENIDLDYVRLFDKQEADWIFQTCEKEIQYNTGSQVRVYGKWRNIPRQQVAYGDDGLKYTFSGATVAAKPWTMAPVLKQVNDIITSVTGHTFNFVLVNRYKDGSDHIGEHRDDEADLVQGSLIASLSLGQARDFIFRHKDARGLAAKRKIDPIKLELTHGSLLMMNHPTNEFWYHSLPVRKKAALPRINLTFRQMVVSR